MSTPWPFLSTNSLRASISLSALGMQPVKMQARRKSGNKYFIGDMSCFNPMHMFGWLLSQL